MAHDRPYSVELAISMASWSVEAAMMPVTGPKIYSWAMRMPGVMLSKTVGSRKLPRS